MKNLLKATKRFRKKRTIAIVLIIVVAILGFSLTRPKEIPQLFAVVERQDIRSTLSYSGTLTGKSTANLKFGASGRLARLNVKVGDIAHSGQTVAQLNMQDLSSALEQAKNNLRDKEAALEVVLDEVKGHEKDETFVQKQKRTQAQVAKDNAYEALRGAQAAFRNAIIVAPFTGLITQAQFTVGQNISASDTTLQIVDTKEIYFDTEVDEADLDKLTPGQAAEIKLEAYPDKVFPGKVDQILPQTKTTGSGATIVTTRIKLDGSPVNFVNGLTGEATIILSEVKGALTIPQEAIGQNDTVFVEEKNGIKPKKIKMGISSDTKIEVKEGLVEGEKILINPPDAAGTINRRQGILSQFRFLGGGRGGR